MTLTVISHIKLEFIPLLLLNRGLLNFICINTLQLPCKMKLLYNLFFRLQFQFFSSVSVEDEKRKITREVKTEIHNETRLCDEHIASCTGSKRH